MKILANSLSTATSKGVESFTSMFTYILKHITELIEEIKLSATSYYSFLKAKTNSKGCWPLELQRSGFAPKSNKVLTASIFPVLPAAISGVSLSKS